MKKIKYTQLYFINMMATKGKSLIIFAQKQCIGPIIPMKTKPAKR